MNHINKKRRFTVKKDYLRSVILNLILTRGDATRPELVKTTGARAASVFEAVD